MIVWTCKKCGPLSIEQVYIYTRKDRERKVFDCKVCKLDRCKRRDKEKLRDYYAEYSKKNRLRINERNRIKYHESKPVTPKKQSLSLPYICRTHGEIPDHLIFKRKVLRDGKEEIKRQCKTCRNDYAREYYRKNLKYKESYILKNKSYRERTKSHRLKIGNIWRNRNKEKITQYHKNYYQRDREKYNLRSNSWNIRNGYKERRKNLDSYYFRLTKRTSMKGFDGPIPNDIVELKKILVEIKRTIIIRGKNDTNK